MSHLVCIPSAVSRWINEHKHEWRQQNTADDKRANVAPCHLPVDAWAVPCHLVDIVTEPRNIYDDIDVEKTILMYTFLQ